MVEWLHIWVLRVLVLQQVQAAMQQGQLQTLVPFFTGEYNLSLYEVHKGATSGY